MKIIQVNCHYNYGSTGKIMYDVNNFLNKKGVESIQCYARGKNVDFPPFDVLTIPFTSTFPVYIPKSSVIDLVSSIILPFVVGNPS